MRPLLVLLSAFLLAPSLAFAGDDDDDLLGDDEEEKDKPTRIEEDDKIETEDDESLDQLDGKDSEGGDDLLGEEVGADKIGGPGQDNASIYRSFQEKVKDEPPDEELIRWEAYLEKYPNSLFKDRIEKRQEELEQLMYAERIDDGSGDTRLDADQKEIIFSQGLQLDNINPRERFQFGFEWGIPNYINLIADYEHSFQRNLSMHIGARHRYTGWRVETGVRYALIKSVRTQTLVTGILDVHMNTNPAYPVLRPMVAAGKRFGGKLDAQLQIGTELDTRGQAAPRLVGGANVMYRAADTVGLFLETTAYQQGLKDTLGAQEWKGGYAFNGLNFGIKFYPKVSGIDDGDFEANVGASVPYYTDHWMYHYGSIMGQGNLYFD